MPTTRKEEAQERLLQVLTLLESCWSIVKIRRALASKWNCSPRSVDRWVTKARRTMDATCQMTKQEKASEVISGIKAIIANPSTSQMVRMSAFKELSKIYGIRAPKEIALQDSRQDAQELMDAANQTAEGREAARLGAQAIVRVSEERMQRLSLPEPGRN